MKDVSEVGSAISGSKISSSAQIGNGQTDIEKQLDAEYARLGELFSQEEKNFWEIADIVYRMTEIYHVSGSALAVKYKRSASRISDYAATAGMFPVGSRRPELTFWQHELARIGVNRVQHDISAQIGAEYVIDPQEALDAVVSEEMHIKNEIINFLMGKARKDVRPARPAIPQVTGLVGNFHHSDCRDILAQVAEYSIQVLNLDPPYGNYRKYKSGRLDSSTSAGIADADCLTEADALEVTCAMFPLAVRRLKVGGVILLWQSSLESLRGPILNTIANAGFMVEMVVTWDKGHQQMARLNAPWVPQSEICYVIKRTEDELLDYSPGEHRGNVIAFPPVQQKRTLLEEFHMWQKPYDLCEYLVAKHSAPGDLVFDAFGASGMTALAAHRLGMRWVYCEKNQKVFEEFVPRLVRDMGIKPADAA